MERQASRAALASLQNRVSDGADVAQVADMVVTAWQRTAFILKPIIGERGMSALYQRSLYVSGREYEWLRPCYQGIQGAMDLTSLKAALALQQCDVAVQGGAALFTAFYDLLASLVGEALTTRLLYALWENSYGAPTAQDGSQ